MKKHIFKSLILSLALFSASCASKAPVDEFDRTLDQRIQRDLEKRKVVVKRNPTYLNLVSDLEKGRKLLLSGNPEGAFESFDRILGNARYTNYPEYSYAKYYLSVALYEMGIDYGALLYFVDIVQKEPLRLHTHESLRRAIAIAQKLKDDELILYLASSITPDKVPLSLREEFRYFIGKNLYKRKKYKKALELLTSIPHRNRLYLASKYLMGTIEIQRKRWKNAIENFRTISNTRSPIEYYENQKIRQLANLALGRIFYEQRKYPLSIVYYDKITRDDEFFPVAMYETSWVLFKLRKFNEALSVLHSLNSPFFDQIYFIKSWLLKGAILIELCYYEDAVNDLRSLAKEFDTLRRQIDRFAKQARSPRQYYPILSSTIQSPDGEKTFKYPRLFKLSAANRDFQGVHRYINRLKAERRSLGKIKTSRADLLAKLIQQKESALMVQASWLAGKKLLLTRELIRDFGNVEDIIQYEIISAERKILQSRTHGIAPRVLKEGELIKPEFTESLKESLTWWDYRGEYWEDELGYYLYNLESRCKSDSAKR